MNPEDVEIKINLIKAEKYLNYYSVTKSKKIQATNIERSPSVHLLVKNMPEFSVDEELYKVEFFEYSKYVIACAASVKCLVSSYGEGSMPNRVINVGFDMIGDVFMLRAKFFGVTHP